jgi:hypothetical protein
VGGRGKSPMILPLAGGKVAVITLWELVMVLDLHRQGLSINLSPKRRRVDPRPCSMPPPGTRRCAATADVNMT